MKGKGTRNQTTVKRTIKNTVKFNKLLEHIQRLLIKTISDQTISYEDIANLKTRASLLFDIYNDNPKTGDEKKHKKQSSYFKYLLYIKNKNKKNGKRTQATPPTLSVRD